MRKPFNFVPFLFSFFFFSLWCHWPAISFQSPLIKSHRISGDMLLVTTRKVEMDGSPSALPLFSPEKKIPWQGGVGELDADIMSHRLQIMQETAILGHVM